MKVSDLLETRSANWRELEQLCSAMQGRSRRKMPARAVSRFSTLYRAACADLALADAYQLPPDVVQYLHQLVGQAHNQLYRSRSFHVAAWARVMLVDVPQRLFQDNFLRLAFVIFWGAFLLSSLLASTRAEYAERVIGREMLDKFSQDFAEPISNRSSNEASLMAGFYIYHNGGIGLRCFAFGLVFGIGGLYTLLFNAAMLGAVFGHMGNLPQSDNFYHFVTAHAPFELTAVVLSAAAGMRLGFSLIDTKGLSRVESLRRAGTDAVPTIWAAVIMFLLAALIEGFLSPSAAPYWVKAVVAVFSAGLLMFYFVMLGYPRGG
jgi:uncharacterized membrane protein SpoIIM required for sporulation